MIAGGVLILYGLNLWQGLSIVVVGSLAYLIVGLCSLPGPRAGTATLIISRAPFGLRGNSIPTAFSWAATLGWETVNIIIGTFAIKTLLEQAGIPTPHWMLAPFLVIMAILTFAIPVLGHATLVVAQKWLSYLLTALTLVMAALTISNVHWDYQPAVNLAASTPMATWFLGLATVLGAGAMSWVNFASDYSRYLPRNSDRAAIVGWVTFANFIPSVLYGGLGVIIGTLVDTSDPVGNLPKILPNWFLFPFLIVIIAGVIANNVMNSYSSGLNLLALGVKVARYKSVLIDGVITVCAACIALFVYDFSTVFTQFLSLLVIVMSPWAGIFIVDYFRRRGQYKSHDLVRDSGGAYWYNQGFNWPALDIPDCWHRCRRAMCKYCPLARIRVDALPRSTSIALCSTPRRLIASLPSLTLLPSWALMASRCRRVTPMSVHPTNSTSSTAARPSSSSATCSSAVRARRNGRSANPACSSTFSRGTRATTARRGAIQLGPSSAGRTGLPARRRLYAYLQRTDE